MNYWEQRYKNNGTSGMGSRGENKSEKWNIIKSYIPDPDNIIDVGCGDLAFLSGMDFKNYIGIDISPTIISQNKESHPNWNFICENGSVYIPKINEDVVLCMDVLFHIMDDNEYIRILQNLTKYSNEYIFLYTWYINPLKSKLLRRAKTHDKYQCYRNFNEYLPIIIESGFELLKVHVSNINSCGAMYVFQKKRNDI